MPVVTATHVWVPYNFYRSRTRLAQLTLKLQGRLRTSLVGSRGSSDSTIINNDADATVDESSQLTVKA